MTPEQYLEETKHATELLFEILENYRRILEDAPFPWSEEVVDEYFGNTVSRGTICGSILQIAFMGIQKFSENVDVTENFAEIIKPNSNTAKFCTGRQVHGIPIGLIIYAARNQYNHMDCQRYKIVTTEVFEILTTKTVQEGQRNPQFDLKERHLHIYSDNILTTIGWLKFENYHQDLSQLLIK